MTRTVHVVAVAARTAVGWSAESTSAAVRAGVSRVRAHPFMVDATGARLRCGWDAGIDATRFGADRVIALARHAVSEVREKLGAQCTLQVPLRLMLALPEPRPGFTEEDATRVIRGIELGEAGVSALRVQATERGHAGALPGLERAAQEIGAGGEEVLVVAGADSYLEANTLDWLDAELRLAREGIRSGFPPGEGAAAVALAGDRARSALGLPSLARVRAVACAIERRDPKSEEGLLGEALTEAIRRAAGALHVGEVLSDVYLDANGERCRTDDWSFALLRTAEVFRDGSDYRMATPQCGELGAASAPLGVVLAVQAWRRGYAHGPLALTCASSWSGLRGAAVLEGSVP
jgi:3-oxoacyl-[acyl-carrier-protein] synthase-1